MQNRANIGVLRKEKPAKQGGLLNKWWKGQDLNLCTRKRPDLQSGAINHSATLPHRFQTSKKENFTRPVKCAMNNLMKHTGKPPKKSTSRTPVGGKGPGSRGKPLRSKGAEDRKPRHARGDNDRSASRFEGKPAQKDTRNAEARVTARPGSRKPERFEKSRPEKSYSEKSRYDKAGAADRPGRDSRSDIRPARTARPEREKREPRASLGPRANMFGLHAVREAWLNPKRYIHALYLSESAEAQFAPAQELAISRGLERPAPKILSRDDFDRLLGRDVVHQGIALSAAPLEESFLQDILSVAANKKRSVILMLDQVTDPHNVGAILRSACAFGADGVIMQRRHAPELEGVLAKTASGAADHILVAYETNLSRTLEELADAGYVTIGLDEHAEKSLAEIEMPEKSVLVLGAEGDGMRRLIREHCDVLVTLPTRAPIASLNVSNAAAVALYALING